MSHNTGLVDGLHRYLRISYGEMDDNNAATYMMQGSNYNDTRKPQGERILMRPPWLYCQRHILLLQPTSDACFKDF